MSSDVLSDDDVHTVISFLRSLLNSAFALVPEQRLLRSLGQILPMISGAVLTFGNVVWPSLVPLWNDCVMKMIAFAKVKIYIQFFKFLRIKQFLAA